MEIPGRIFIAIGKEADSIIDSERKRQSAEADRRRMESERDAALRNAAKLRADLEQTQKITVIAWLILILLISIIALWFWLSPKEPSAPPVSPPPQSEQPPATPPPKAPEIPKPPPRPNVPSRRCMRGCGPPDYWEYPSWQFHSGPRYRHFECWRDRSVQGPCFG